MIIEHDGPKLLIIVILVDLTIQRILHIFGADKLISDGMVLMLVDENRRFKKDKNARDSNNTSHDDKTTFNTLSKLFFFIEGLRFYHTGSRSADISLIVYCFYRFFTQGDYWALIRFRRNGDAGKHGFDP